MALENLYIRFSGNAAESRAHASKLQQYLKEQSARADIPLTITIEDPGQEPARLKLSIGSRSEEVIGWVVAWFQEHSSVTAFAEDLHGNSVIKLSPPQARRAERPRELPDSEFRTEFTRFKF